MVLRKSLLRLSLTYSNKHFVHNIQNISSKNKIYARSIENPLNLQNWLSDYCKLQTYATINDFYNYEVLKSQLENTDINEFDFTIEIPNIEIKKMPKAFVIKIDNSIDKNSSTTDMYEGLTEALNYSLEDRTTSITVIKGQSQFHPKNNSTMDKNHLDFDKNLLIYEKFILSLIDHDKPLIGLINGPTIGIMAEILPLLDYILASDNTYFKTLAVKNGFIPGGCSTFTFPHLIGRQNSFDFLWKGQSISAMKGKNLGLINSVVKSCYFDKVCERKIRQFSKLDPVSLIVIKKLFRDNNRKNLYKCLNKEKMFKRLLQKDDKFLK